MKDFLEKHCQTVVNWIVFVCIARWIVVKAIDWHEAGELWQFVELTFLAHMALLLVLLVIRRKHIAIDRNPVHQAVALVAFFSGLAFTGAKTDDPSLLLAAQIITAGALILGIACQLNLGRSFGILIAQRKIKTRGLYGLVRHPMYLTDMLFKVGMLVKMVSWPNVGVFALGVGCYVYRALLEEKFLSREETYRQYMKQVRYRFLPGIF